MLQLALCNSRNGVKAETCRFMTDHAPVTYKRHAVLLLSALHHKALLPSTRPAFLT